MLANPIRGQVGFEADGESFLLSYSVNALVTLENELGMKVAEIGATLFSDGAALGSVRTVFWAGLLDHQPQVTETAAGLMMSALGLDKAGELVGRAFIGAFPAPEAGKTKADPRKAGGTGPRSTAAGAKSASNRKDFWTLTPRLISLAMDGRFRAARRRRDEQMSLAWHTAVLCQINPKRFPPLSSLLQEQPARPEMTPAQVEDAFASWATSTAH